MQTKEFQEWIIATQVIELSRRHEPSNTIDKVGYTGDTTMVRSWLCGRAMHTT